MTARERALELWEKGTERLLEGELEVALEFYGESIELCPTAEAHTFRAWAYSFEDRYDEAIRECRRAIELDPDFGNPYNDIGSYLIALDRIGEAVDWFERAKRAPRYEPRHFPYLNLGKLYAIQGRNDLAAIEFEEALAINPGDPVASAFLEKHPPQVN